jgi:hypothetical protein
MRRFIGTWSAERGARAEKGLLVPRRVCRPRGVQGRQLDRTGCVGELQSRDHKPARVVRG